MIAPSLLLVHEPPQGMIHVHVYPSSMQFDLVPSRAIAAAF